MRYFPIIILICLLSIIPLSQAKIEINSHSNLNPYSAITWPPKITGTTTHPNTQSVRLTIEHNSQFWDGNDWVNYNTFVLATFANNQFEYDFAAPTNSGDYKIRSLAIDSNSLEIQGEISEVTTVYDNDPPFAEFDPTIPEWTSDDKILLSFTGSDSETGIDHFELNYQIEDNSLIIQPWTTLGTIFTSPSFHWFDINIVNNYSYNFTVKAIDKAGNEYTSPVESTIIDNLIPYCAMDPLPSNVPSQFSIKWNAVENISGLSSLSVEFLDTEWKDVTQNCNPFSLTDNFTTCIFSDGTYQFRCKADDVAGGVGKYSEPITTIVDSSKPSNPQITNPSLPYTNSYVFPLSWYSPDPDIKCYYVQWKNLTFDKWEDIINETDETCLDITEMTFGDGSIPGDKGRGDPVIQPNDGETYFFRMSAIDIVGNPSEWSEIVTTVIDTEAPSLTMTALDQNNNPIGQGISTKIIIDTQATDPISGLLENFISIEITNEKVYLYTQKCTTTTCHLEQDIEGADQVVFYSHAYDNAQNIEKTEKIIISPHPLSNFVTHDTTLTMGTIFLAEVQVRNMEPSPADISLMLDGYDLAGFTHCTGDFSDCTVSQDKRSANIVGMPSYGTGTLTVEIIPSDPGDVTPFLNVTSTSGSIVDDDSMFISVRFPASFSGMNDLAVILLIILSVAIFLLKDS